MQIRLRLGPAGSGKTFRCLKEIREALKGRPEGPWLLLLAPKQATYQLERQLLADEDLAGYTRLKILSFERLAQFVLEQIGQRASAMLDEEGRLMVLRGLLARRRNELKLFRASARLTGFAQELSLVLRELQREQATPERLRRVASGLEGNGSLAAKLQDLALLLEAYLEWLAARQLQDADCLLQAAAKALSGADAAGRLSFERVWLDGFAELSQQELDLLAALLPSCGEATLAFCLDANEPGESWLSGWSVLRQTVERCRKKLAGVAGGEVSTEWLERRVEQGRFSGSPVLSYLESHWDSPEPFPIESDRGEDAGAASRKVESALRVACCLDPESEAQEAAREILRYIRAGGRYRESAVLVRDLEAYHRPVQRVFARYEIPFFLDRREAVSHHPLAELTRSGLRTAAFDWQADDWFAALKTELVPADALEIDWLENEALARGWQGPVWQRPLIVPGQSDLTEKAARLQKRIMPPFQKLALDLARCEGRPTGAQLAAALRDFWRALSVQERLEQWAAQEPSNPGQHTPNSVHSTVWDQMNQWLENLELAFARERLTLREWLPILEAGLGSLTVGVVPPALDQVLVGAIDRSRNPDLKLAVVLGLNESVFPSRPQAPLVLSESDRVELEQHALTLGGTPKRHLGRERYYGYIACTRARERLVLTYAQRDAQGTALNPSSFLTRIGQLFPMLACEMLTGDLDWRAAEHPVELLKPVLAQKRTRQELTKAEVSGPADAEMNGPFSELEHVSKLPPIATRLEALSHLRTPDPNEGLSPELADALYGPVLRSSVSRLEQFAACPFRFFLHSGLRAEERKRFEADVKEQGSFQHDALALFHEKLRAEGKQWRDLAPQEARNRLAAIAASLSATYREGLFQSDPEARFTAEVLTESLQGFVETLVGWMRSQYQFEPAAVELAFGEEDDSPAWGLELDATHRLELRGRIDRVDVCREGEDGTGWCLVVDYKSSQKQLEPLLMAEGLQLQLLAYLNVVRRWPNPREQFGFERLAPAGVFYVNLRGKPEHEEDRRAALGQAAAARRLAYRHSGRFDNRVLRQLDARSDARQGDQFNYRLNKSGTLNGNCREPMPPEEFEALLDSVEANLKRMGRRIYSGAAEVAPFRKGNLTACDQCSYQAVCRFDPWTQPYRSLRSVGDDVRSL